MELIVFVLLIVAIYLLVKLPKFFAPRERPIDDVTIEAQVTSTQSASGDDEDSDGSGGRSELYWFPVEDRARKLTARIKMRYVDTHGNETSREMDVRAFYRGQGGCHFEGLDHLRKARRKLSSKCVKEAIDLDTGEVLNDLVAFFERKYREHPEYPYDNLFEKHGQEIYLLVHIASADGAMRAAERKIIASYCMEQEGFKALDPVKLDGILKDLYRPTKHEFHKYVRETKLHSIGAKKVWAVANAIVGTSAKPHSEPTRALEYMQKQWKDRITRDAPLSG